MTHEHNYTCPEYPSRDLALIAVLQTEREHVRQELRRLGVSNPGDGHSALDARYYELNKRIKEAVGI